MKKRDITDDDSRIGIGLVEDDPILRANYEEFFSHDPLFNVVFALPDTKLLHKLSLHNQPQIILLDLMLPSGNSLNELLRIKQLFPVTNIVILSAVSHPDTTQTAMRNGAAGFLLKTSSLFFIKEALLKLADGGIPISPVLVNHLLHTNEKKSFAELHPDLTRKEVELINLLNTGMSNKMAADALNVTYFTINSHLKNIYTKLGINSKSELIALTMK